METITFEELTMIENRFNHRPRKLLGFITPHDVFHASLNRVAAPTCICQLTTAHEKFWGYDHHCLFTANCLKTARNTPCASTETEGVELLFGIRLDLEIN
jgi:hypothetical protein